MDMPGHHQQLLVEIYTADVQQSASFYEAVGFETLRVSEYFAELSWGDTRMYLELVNDQPPATAPTCNLQIRVANVDEQHNRCTSLGLDITRPLENRDYGLRDFTILGPDGVSLRFATPT